VIGILSITCLNHVEDWCAIGAAFEHEYDHSLLPISDVVSCCPELF
jgi:hypothetical protein